MPRLLVLVFWCLIASFCRADDQRLIRPGAVWTFLKGYVEPSDPIGSWIFPEFNDQNWARSISGFSTAAYNPEPGYAYVWDYGLGYRTIYFRKTFNVQDPQSLAELVLRVDYDDGFIAYLNGQEVARRGVAG